MTGYTPTDNEIRTGFSLNYARDYEEPNNSFYFEACRIGEQAFSRWLEEHDRQVAERAWIEGKRAGWCEGYSHGEPEPSPYRKAES